MNNTCSANARLVKQMLVISGDNYIRQNREDGKGTINHVSEHIYLGVRITKDGNHQPEINDRINRG
jgi:hypothetical protein